MHGYDEPVYLISIVSKMLNIHPQTLRQYERDGLIKPSRTKGRMRLYSQRDIDKMKVILRLKEQIEELEVEIDRLRDELSSVNRHGVVSKSKAIVAKSRYDLIIFEGKDED